MIAQGVNEINRNVIASDYLDMRTRVSRRNIFDETNIFTNKLFGQIPDYGRTFTISSSNGKIIFYENGIPCEINSNYLISTWSF